MLKKEAEESMSKRYNEKKIQLAIVGFEDEMQSLEAGRGNKQPSKQIKNPQSFFLTASRK